MQMRDTVRYSLDDSEEKKEVALLKSLYQRELSAARREFPVPRIGRINPYTQTEIQTKEEWDEYLRQYAISRAYQGQLDELSGRLAVQEGKIKHLQSNVRQLETDLQSLGKKRKVSFRTAIAFGLALCLALFVLLPTLRSRSYNTGHAAGYSEGMDAGNTAGYAAGYEAGSSERSVSASASPSASDSSTVYVSRNGVIHKSSTCSGMKYYTVWSYDDAIAAGYRLCSKCY